MIEAYERVLGPLGVRRRQIALESGRHVHVLESGTGPPALILHGSNTSTISLAPLIERLDGVRMIAVDRPGLGLSDPAPVRRHRFRTESVALVEAVMDRMGLAAATLVGNSMGGIWALWCAMARPERVHGIVLLGSVPLLPGTSPPTPLRIMTTPLVGDVLSRLVKPTPRMLVRLLSSVGEGGTIVRYPDLMDAMAATSDNPVARRTNLAELRAVLHPFGFRRSMTFRPDELRSLTVPVLMIWGDHDPVGSADVARAAADLIPDVRLEILDAGHVPFFGHPGRSAELISGFAQAVGR
jgi:pimeloyl-ACP methyl ester carboxylesterase